MTKTLAQVLEIAESAIRLSPTAMHIYELAQNPEVVVGQFLSAIESDPALATQLLRLANTPVYSRGSEIATLERAVARVGHREIGDLALAMASASEFTNIQSELFQLDAYWNHSIATAVLARNLGRRYANEAESVFCAGLLHDIGQLILAYTCPDEIASAIEQTLDENSMSLYFAEQDLLGFDHTVVGAALAESWGLPRGVVATCRYHHTMLEATDAHATVACVAIANSMESADLSEDGELELPDTFLLDAQSALGKNFQPDIRLLRAARNEAQQMRGVFY